MGEADWEAFKKVCPCGWVHGKNEKIIRDLYFHNRPELVRRLIKWKKNRIDQRVIDEVIQKYQMVVRSDRMRAAGERLLLLFRDETLSAPPDDCSPIEFALWVQDYIPRRKFYSRAKGSNSLRASGFRVDRQNDCFSNDNEFQRAIKHMVDLGIIEVRSEIVLGKKSRSGKNKASTFYRLKILDRHSKAEGWSPDDEPVVRTKRALMREALFWTGWNGQDVIEFSIDRDLERRMMERVRTTLIEIFGVSEVQRMEKWLDEIDWRDPYVS